MIRKYSRFIIGGLCAIALVGFFLPAIKVEISFFGNTIASNFSLATAFEDNDGAFGGMDFAQSDLAKRLGVNDIMNDVGGRIAFSVVSYLVVLVLLLCGLVFTGLERLPRFTTAAIAYGAILYIAAGRVILTVPGILLEGVENMMGFLALFIDFSEILAISLGAGYWLTMIVLVFVVLAKVSVLLHTKHKKNKIERGA